MADTRATRNLIILTIVILVILLTAALIYALIYNPRSTTASTVGCSSLPPPTGVVAISTELSKIKVSWNPVINAARYHVYIGSIPGFSKTTSFNDFYTGDLEYTITGMVLGRTYYIKVATVNGCTSEGLLSSEKSVTLGFPPKFRIVSRDQPTLALRVAPDFNNIIVDSFCSGNVGDDLCIWTYDPDTSYMTSVSSPLICMKTFPAAVDLRVKYEPCAVITSGYNWSAARQWNYDTANNSLCNPINPEGLNCIKINGSSLPGQSTVRVPFDGLDTMKWDIVEFQP